MAYTSLEDCLNDLEKNGQLTIIKEEVDPYLEMAAIQRIVYQQQGPAILFEKVKDSKFRAVANIFGTLDRSKFIFRNSLKSVQDLIQIKNNPAAAFRKISALSKARFALPKKQSLSKLKNFEEIRIQDLPLITCWEMDGGAFITLPQVFSQDPINNDIAHSNIGMYRIQLSGNEYIANKEIGLHYQIHRGIGIHQQNAIEQNQPLKVSIFVGGPPAHTVAAVMPLPEGMSEVNFAGLLAGRRFRYAVDNGNVVSLDADFVITGEINPNELKPEGPFGDHLGYYSLAHPFPVLKVSNVLAKKNAIWPFTVVGRPPQEDTSFGALIHEITGDAIKNELPGVQEVHAVDAAGVHPLLLAIGKERYTPYLDITEPAEILTQSMRILGTGQLSLAKYLFITSQAKDCPSTHDIPAYFRYIFERIDFKRDIHFITNTTIDTLDYSGFALNKGSKVIFATAGKKLRELATNLPKEITNIYPNAKLVLPGIVAIDMGKYDANIHLDSAIENINLDWENLGIAMIVITENPDFLCENLNNFLWVTFTRTNPAKDILGIHSFYSDKHWGCEGPIILDARIKPHHAPALEENPEVYNRALQICKKYQLI
ncbi:UbiD family decarboxylase [Rhizosphaericola mali]|uniref:UbiD family decarboxylase n=1 Tax=Rhizosphaericola mali TaxID=2545455 RepID=A0A5P2FYE4_9BACT|nr:UbiD family decarboxylase [Rhizosphaericola mali]QES87957.1 UbiD family decarboxylase [Rhizosphaericola mali]